MKRQSISLLHLGPGNVGKAFLRQLLQIKPFIEKDYGINIKITGIFNSNNGLFHIDGIRLDAVWKICEGQKIANGGMQVDDIIKLIRQNPKPSIVIDTTSSDKLADILLAALNHGAYLIMSNKKPLSSDYSIFNNFMTYEHRVFFETTVGAGLPIISTLKDLIFTGDKVILINGCFSGTLGFIFSQLEKGISFSQVVREAKQLRFTEPDPRDDLSGADVARKALILGRLIGLKINLEDIHVQSLYPDSMKNIPIKEFLVKIQALDVYYKNKVNEANKNKTSLRYVAEITPKNLTVGLKQVDILSEIGSLTGPDNIVVMKTKRYSQQPLVIKGPGAGLEVTAAGVMADVLKVIRIIKGESL